MAKRFQPNAVKIAAGPGNYVSGAGESGYILLKGKLGNMDLLYFFQK